MINFNMKALGTAFALAGLITASAYVQADNSASAYVEPAVIGSDALAAGGPTQPAGARSCRPN
jgi:hypothetical protein